MGVAHAVRTAVDRRVLRAMLYERVRSRLCGDCSYVRDAYTYVHAGRVVREHMCESIVLLWNYSGKHNTQRSEVVRDRDRPSVLSQSVRSHVSDGCSVRSALPLHLLVVVACERALIACKYRLQIVRDLYDWITESAEQS